MSRSETLMSLSRYTQRWIRPRRTSQGDVHQGDVHPDNLPNFCRTTCVVPSCGDGVVDLDEECDGGVEGASNCSATCLLVDDNTGTSAGCQQTEGQAGIAMLLFGWFFLNMRRSKEG